MSPAHANPPEAVRALFAARGLSLADIAQASRTRFSNSPLFRIPPNFYEALRRPSFSPSLHQLFALSVLTQYRLADWLDLFGLSFDDAARFQSAWPQRQTTELDARVYDPGDPVPWFEERLPIQFGREITPLSHWLYGRTTRPLHSLSKAFGHSFRYLKIGSRDAYAFPDLLPGSIVRVDGRIAEEALLAEENSGHILAIEHSRGIVCSRIRSEGRGRVVLCSGQLPYAPVELQVGLEANILGVVDIEIRLLWHREVPEVSRSAARLWTPEVLPVSAPSGGIGKQIREARIRSALSLREASEKTREISQVLRHPNYFCAVSSLSDMEASDRIPRHIHKLISVSAIYGLSLAELARLGGLDLEAAGKEAMPSRWNFSSRRGEVDRVSPSSFLDSISDRFEEIPYFLRSALPSLLGLPHLSVRDFFWAGATRELSHPYLRDSAFLVVNRRGKVPTTSLSSPVWAQPLYLLELRDGRRLCAPCSLQNGYLVIRQRTTSLDASVRLRNGVDADVLGEVIAIVRRVGAQKEIDAVR